MCIIPDLWNIFFQNLRIENWNGLAYSFVLCLWIVIPFVQRLDLKNEFKTPRGAALYIVNETTCIFINLVL